MASLYKAYLFRDKDPVIPQLQTLMETYHGERLRYEHFRAVEWGGGPKARTVRNMFWGKTMRPQSATIEAIGRAHGFMRTWVKLNGRAVTVPRVPKPKKNGRSK